MPQTPVARFPLPGDGSAAEEPWAERLRAHRLVVRALLARELGLSAVDPTLDDGEQEVLRRAIEGRHRLAPQLPIRPWLLGIARHVALDEKRRRRRLVVGVIDFETLECPAPIEDPAAKRERLERVRRAIAALPAHMEKALRMFHLEHFTYREIARALGVSTGTVGTWIARGREQLARLVDREDEDS